MNLPDGVDWWHWRLLTSPKLRVRDMRDLERWSIDEAVAAHAVLDELERLEEQARRDAERDAK